MCFDLLFQFLRLEFSHRSNLQQIWQHIGARCSYEQYVEYVTCAGLLLNLAFSLCELLLRISGMFPMKDPEFVD